MTTPNAQSVPTRSEANSADTWDLSLMYADDAAWRTELATIDGRIDAMNALVGTISTGAAAPMAA